MQPAEPFTPGRFPSLAPTEPRHSQRGHSPHVLDEPTTGRHPSHVEKRMAQLRGW